MSQPWPPQGFGPQNVPGEGYGLPVPYGSSSDDRALVTIGDITCTQREVITPSGRRPINAVTWTFTDLSQTTTTIPTWAIVLAIIFLAACLLGLLFLLAKETRTTGWVQITVQGDRFLHQTQLPVFHPHQVVDYNSRVSYARSLSVAL
jgi:hypothetical protein